MVERRESVRVSATGDDFKREFHSMRNDALELAAALKAVPNRVDVKAEARGFDRVESEARRAERSSSALLDIAVALGPAFVPVGALAVPALAGLTAQLTFAVGAGGAALLAFNGVGDALTAMREYGLDPSVANAEKLNETLRKLGPSGREFVAQLDTILPKLKQLKGAAEDGILDGVGDSIDSLMTRLPQVRRIVEEISNATGGLAAEGGRNLAGARSDEFFTYLEDNAGPILEDTGRAVGNLTLAIMNLLSGTAPQQRQFTRWLLDSSRDLATWADGVDETDGFRELMAYIDETGPKVANALGSIGNALLQVAEAGAPLGGPVLDTLASVADLVARIADSPVGPPLIALAGGLALLNRALVFKGAARGSTLGRFLAGDTAGLDASRAKIRSFTADLRAANSLGGFAGPKALASPAELQAQAAAAGRLRSNLAGLAKGTAAVGGLAFATSGLAENMNAANTASYALLGTMAGPFGVAAGAAVGYVMDVKAANDQLAASAAAAKAVFEDQTSTLAEQQAQLKSLREQTEIFQPKPSNLASLLIPFKGQMQAARGVLGGLTGTAGDAMDAYQQGLDRIKTDKATAELRALRASQEAAGQGFVLTEEGADIAAASVEDFAAAIAAANEELSGRQNLRDYEAALDDFQDTLKEAERSLKGKSLLNPDGQLNRDLAEGRAVEEQLDRIASTAHEVAAPLQGLDHVRVLSQARADFIKAATDAGIARGEAKRLATQLGLLETIDPDIGITADMGKAYSAVNQFILDISGKSVAVDVYTRPSSGLDGLLGGGGGGGGKGPGSRRATPTPPPSYAPSPLFTSGQRFASSAVPSRPAALAAPPSLDGLEFTLRADAIEVPGIGPAILRGARLVVRQEQGMVASAARAGARR